MDVSYNNRVLQELPDLVALQASSKNAAAIAANHAFALSTGTPTVPNGSYGVLATVSGFTPKVSGKLRILVSAVFLNSISSNIACNLGIGVGPHGGSIAKVFNIDPAFVFANSNGTASIVWETTAVVGVSIDIAAMGQSNNSGTTVGTNDVQISVQEIP